MELETSPESWIGNNNVTVGPDSVKLPPNIFPMKEDAKYKICKRVKSLKVCAMEAVWHHRKGLCVWGWRRSLGQNRIYHPPRRKPESKAVGPRTVSRISKSLGGDIAGVDVMYVQVLDIHLPPQNPPRPQLPVPHPRNCFLSAGFIPVMSLRQRCKSPQFHFRLAPRPSDSQESETPWGNGA